jgi:hypothetical protein
LNRTLEKAFLDTFSPFEHFADRYVNYQMLSGGYLFLNEKM